MLAAANLDFAYGARTALHNAALFADAGEVVGLVGPNGSGKTTLLKCVAGLLEPSAGSVAYDGTPLAELSPRQRAAARAYVPQGASEPFPYSIGDVVSMGLAHRRRFFGSPHAPQSVADALAEVGATLEPDRRFDALSGGECQQVLVARALIQGAALLLLDEPTSALDLKHRAAVARAVRRRAAAGAAIVLSMHELNLASRLCDRLVLLSAGEVASVGTPPEVLQREVLAPVYGVDVICGRHPELGVATVDVHPEAMR